MTKQTKRVISMLLTAVFLKACGTDTDLDPMLSLKTTTSLDPYDTIYHPHTPIINTGNIYISYPDGNFQNINTDPDSSITTLVKIFDNKGQNNNPNNFKLPNGPECTNNTPQSDNLKPELRTASLNTSSNTLSLEWNAPSSCMVRIFPFENGNRPTFEIQTTATNVNITLPSQINMSNQNTNIIVESYIAEQGHSLFSDPRTPTLAH